MLPVLNPPLEESVAALLEAAWMCKIKRSKTFNQSIHIYEASKSDRLSAFIHILIFEEESSYTSYVPISLYDWAWYQEARMKNNIPIIVVALLGTDCKFIGLQDIYLSTETMFIVDDEPYAYVPTDRFKFVGKVIPRAETEYANAG